MDNPYSDLDYRVAQHMAQTPWITVYFLWWALQRGKPIRWGYYIRYDSQ